MNYRIVYYRNPENTKPRKLEEMLVPADTLADFILSLQSIGYRVFAVFSTDTEIPALQSIPQI